MEVLKVDVIAPSASFRRPRDHNYQRSFPIPPPTTLMGVLGAALGLSMEEMWKKDSIIKNVKISVVINNKPGKSKDMWAIQKIKEKNFFGRSPYYRELLFFTEFTLFFGTDRELLKKIEKKIWDPEYALSLGRDDEIFRIVKSEIIEANKGYPEFVGTILPLDLRKISFYPEINEGLNMEPLIIESLPVSFKLSRGKRIPNQNTVFTFVPPSLPIKIEDEIENIYNIDGRNFLWLNHF